jgi:hypothetical protein
MEKRRRVAEDLIVLVETTFSLYWFDNIIKKPYKTRFPSVMSFGNFLNVKETESQG